ncbi:hypothetical protein BDV96DRAFT_149267 [Lophiotrema nucula]|uniref:F-box domain-containing protein n=1 Tax=Lophiotrema nucula TaxID=690887 RepID=A0A6A5Z0P9_9PLEO|nr:hypothetical protein BDV96DRAFT_149267 [Lophiotrema nucula]
MPGWAQASSSCSPSLNNRVLDALRSFLRTQMSAHSISLPCSSHGKCTYHKHWPSTVTRASQPSHHIIEAAKHAREEQRTRRPPSSHLKRSLIQKFPDELLLAICDYLGPMDQACLALTCRALAVTIGPSAWKYVSKAGEASWYKHAEMLDVLQRDFNSEAWWRCSACESFHPRAKTQQDDDHDHLAKASAKFNQMRHLSKDDDGNEVNIGPPKQPLYTLDFSLVHAVMDRHLNGTRKGLCLNSLRCAGSHTFHVLPGVTMSINYAFAPKIVVDRLLMRSEFQFQPKREQLSRNTQAKYQSVQLFLTKNDFWLCRHMQARNLVRVLQQGVMHERKCTYCPSEFSMETLPNEGVRIRSWQNFGVGRSAKETRWMHLSRSFPERKAYTWGKEDIGEAYDRIMCSTREEFDRQLQNSKGPGGRYDPELKRMVYKSLPIKLAERI